MKTNHSIMPIILLGLVLTAAPVQSQETPSHPDIQILQLADYTAAEITAKSGQILARVAQSTSIVH